jgi:hypothetical protein
LKIQINEKEESCCKSEVEIVDLRKKIENSNKLLNSSRIMDDILESQRSSCEKSSLGYKGEDTHAKEITSKKHETIHSNKEDNVAKQPSTQGKENFKRTKQGRHHDVIFGMPKQRYGNCYSCNGYGHKYFECRSYEIRYNGRYNGYGHKKMLQNNHLHKAKKISKEQSKGDIKKLFLGHQSKGMELVIHVMDMVRNILNVDLIKRDIMEDFVTPQGVGDVIK